MASNKFSRPTTVQQPPPRCKQPPPPILPPPPPHGPTLHIWASFAGITILDFPIDTEDNAILLPDMPADFYQFDGDGTPPWHFNAEVTVRPNNLHAIRCLWSRLTEEGEAQAWARYDVTIPYPQPIDTGIVGAWWTNPLDQTSSMRLYTVPL